MSRVDNSLNIITLALVLAISVFAVSVASATTVMAADAGFPTLLWPKESIAAGQSTKALVIGHTGRAVKFAERALDTAKGYDRVVALHNLCLGLLRQGDTARANDICQEAQTGAAAYANEKVVQANIDMTRKAFNQRAATNLADAQR